MIFMTIYIEWFDLEASLDDLLDSYNFTLFILGNLDLNLNILWSYPDWIAILLLVFLLESKITIYEDFLELSVKQIIIYQFVAWILLGEKWMLGLLPGHGWKSSESQSNSLQSNYKKKLKGYLEFLILK